MTVHELIAHLEELPPERPVYVSGAMSGYDEFEISVGVVAPTGRRPSLWHHGAYGEHDHGRAAVLLLRKR